MKKKAGDTFEKIILFTGAGANFPLKIPTTEKLFSKIANNDTRVGITDKSLFQEISVYKDVKDIEHIWYILEKMEETDKLNNEFEFFSNTFYQKTRSGTYEGWNTFLGRTIRLKENIEDVIFDEYILKPSSVPEAYNLYYELIEYIEFLNRGPNGSIIPIFTTNYDRVLDEVATEFNEHTGYHILDGFKPVRNRPSVWSPKEFDNTIKGNNIMLFHLHGSLKWRITPNDEIEKISIEGINRNSITHPKRLVIFPGSIKDPKGIEPYETMHNKLKEYLSNAFYCIVIGFAFRDEYIRDIFIESLITNSKLKIILISPNAKVKLKENPLYLEIKKNRKIANNRIIPIPSGFEEFVPSHLEVVGIHKIV